jgi:YidC/Oxa1 family membrane protein insertase
LAEFKNPNQAGGGTQDNRSLVVMMIVLIAVTFGIQYYRSKHPDAPPPPPPVAQTATPPAAPLGSTAAPVNAGAAAAVAPVETVQAAAESTTVVENELYRITFSNRGGQATSWILKKYHDNDGKPLDMVHEGAAKLLGYPLSIYTYDPTLTQSLAKALYVPSATGTLESPASLTYGREDVYVRCDVHDPRGHAGEARWPASARAGGVASGLWR